MSALNDAYQNDTDLRPAKTVPVGDDTKLVPQKNIPVGDDTKLVPAPKPTANNTPSWRPPTQALPSRPGDGAVPSGGELSSYTTRQWEDLTPELVEDRLTNLLKQDNPYLQQAQTRALQQANARGLLNSSMGVTAGTSAAIDAALPIATTDAGAFNEAYSQHRDARLRAGLREQDFGYDRELQKHDLSSRERVAQIGANAQISAASIAASSREKVAGMEIEFKSRVADMEDSRERDLAAARNQNEIDRINAEWDHKISIERENFDHERQLQAEHDVNALEAQRIRHNADIMGMDISSKDKDARIKENDAAVADAQVRALMAGGMSKEDAENLVYGTRTMEESTTTAWDDIDSSSTPEEPDTAGPIGSSPLADDENQ